MAPAIRCVRSIFLVLQGKSKLFVFLLKTNGYGEGDLFVVEDAFLLLMAFDKFVNHCYFDRFHSKNSQKWLGKELFLHQMLPKRISIR